VTLPKARELRDQARAMVRDGIDPGVERKQRAAETALSAETTFKSVATAWHKLQQRRWKPRYAEQVLQRFEADVFPAIGSLPIQAISAALVLKVMRTIEAREAHEMAHRVRQHISDVFVFAIASGWAEDDPAHVIRKALTPTSPRLRPAVTKLAAARRVLAQTEAQPAYAVTKLAARLVALTAARPGVVRMASPQEFEALDTAMPIWRIPAAKMKLTRERRIDATYEFVIPLSKQAVEVVSVAMELIGTGAPLLFPSVRDFHKPISDNTLSKFYRDAGLRGVHVPHGWRASFSTMMNELAAEDEREDDREIIDMMLAHVRDGVEAAYNRAAYMKRRREISQAWADMLMEGAVAPSTLVVTQRGTSARTLRKRGRDRRLASAPDAAARKASDGRPHRKEPRA
jgi:integrase